MELKNKVSIMKKIVILSMLAISLIISAQIIEQKCKSCGEPISQCQYKGRYPELHGNIQEQSTPQNNQQTLQGKRNRLSSNKREKIEASKLTVFAMPCPDENHPHAIDLGLPSGTKWSCCNIGATKPEDNGDYYAWGETLVKTKYEYNTYVYGDDMGCRNIGYDISCTEFDVAHIKWGDNWGIPSIKQFDELVKDCSYRWGAYKGTAGMGITGPNGSRLFFPATGIKWGNQRYHLRTTGGFWTSTANRSITTPCCFGFTENGMRTNQISAVWDGQSIRPGIASNKQSLDLQNAVRERELVNCPDNNHPHAIDLQLPSGTKWACCNVGATSPENAGKYYAWGETTPKKSYTWENYQHCNGSETGCKSVGMNISGTSHDAAKVEWGEKWCIPTKEQYEELLNNCSFEWLNSNNKAGILLIGSNGRRVFLPAEGYRWKNSLYYKGKHGFYGSASRASGFSSYAYELVFDSHGYSTQIPNYRFCGVSIRAIQQ